MNFSRFQPKFELYSLESIFCVRVTPPCCYCCCRLFSCFSWISFSLPTMLKKISRQKISIEKFFFPLNVFSCRIFHHLFQIFCLHHAVFICLNTTKTHSPTFHEFTYFWLLISLFVLLSCHLSPVVFHRWLSSNLLITKHSQAGSTLHLILSCYFSHNKGASSVRVCKLLWFSIQSVCGCTLCPYHRWKITFLNSPVLSNIHLPADLMFSFHLFSEVCQSLFALTFYTCIFKHYKTF